MQFNEKHYPINIAFIYGYKPSGHYAAAYAISQFMPQEIVKSHFINLSETYPYLGQFVAKTYLQIIQKIPNMWEYLYDNAFLNKATNTVKPFIPEFSINKIKEILVKKHISAIVSTHAFSSILISHKNMNLKHIKNFAVITDIRAHSFWPNQNIAYYFVPTEEAALDLIEKGVNSQKIILSGIPIRKEFNEKYDTNNLKKKLGLNPKLPVFLISGGSRGIIEIKEILEIFLKLKHKTQILILGGENKSLLKEAKTYRKTGLIIKFIPYTKNPSIYYAISDCIISKAGGITIFEVAAYKKFLIIYSPLPGQEERNALYLEKNQCAIYPKTKKELEQIINNFLEDKKKFEIYAQNLNKKYKKDAAFVISSTIIKEILR